MIAKTRSITTQNTYIYKLADLLPDFDYLQVSRLSIMVVCNNGRRLKMVDDLKHRIFSGALAGSHWDDALDQRQKIILLNQDEGFSNGAQ